MPRPPRVNPQFRRMIGAKIAKAREAANLKQAALAMRVGVETGTVGGWEIGHSMPSVQDLAAVAEATGRPLDWFVCKDVPPGLTGYQRDIVALTELMDDDARETYRRLGQELAAASRRRREARR